MPSLADNSFANYLKRAGVIALFWLKSANRTGKRKDEVPCGNYYSYFAWNFNKAWINLSKSLSFKDLCDPFYFKHSAELGPGLRSMMQNNLGQKFKIFHHLYISQTDLIAGHVGNLTLLPGSFSPFMGVSILVLNISWSWSWFSKTSWKPTARFVKQDN